MAKLGAHPWAIILCEFSDINGTPVSRDFCKKYFINKRTNGLHDYWRSLSYGKFSLDGSRVLGPFKLSYSKAAAVASADAQHINSHTNPADRVHRRVFRIKDAIDDLAGQIDYTPYLGVIVIFNDNFDVGKIGATLPLGDGKTRGVPGVVLEPASFTQDALGHLTEHETAHMLGVQHSRRLGAQDEYAARGDTSSNWAYTDGWCISGGIRDDGSGQDCRFNISNTTLLNTRSGPGLKAKSVRDLGWMDSDRVYTYRSHSQISQAVAALNHPESSGALMVQTTPTYSGSARYSVELRWKDQWDRGIPRHAFLVHKIDENGVTHLVPRSPTQHDWAPGERFESGADGIGIDFESIDRSARNGRIRLTRVVGQSADSIIGGGWGMIALQRGTGAPFQYLGRPGQWKQVGDPAAQFAISGNALFGLSNDRKKIWQYTGRGKLWRNVGESADAIVAGDWGLIALQRGTGIPFKYLGRPGHWRRVGGPAAQFAITRNALYGLASDRKKIWRYTGRGQRWVQVGESADALVAGGWGLIALQKGTGVPYRYLDRPGHWTKVGGPAAQFTISKNALYGLASDRRKIWQYSDTGLGWFQVGGAAHSIVAGGYTLFALSPTRDSITRF